MADLKHTPGPWRRIRRAWGDWVVVAGTNVVIGGTEYVGVPEDEQAGNAALFASAPDLLAACEAMQEASQDDLDHNPALWDLLNAAIRKAKGESDG